MCVLVLVRLGLSLICSFVNNVLKIYLFAISVIKIDATNAIKVNFYPKLVHVSIPAHKELFLNFGHANHVQKKHFFALSAMINFALYAHRITSLNLIIACFARTNIRTVRIVIYLDALFAKKIIILTFRVTFA
jgi:hypothetical protein